MSSNIRKVVGSFIFGGATIVVAHAQIWSTCIDPQNNQPYSNDFGIGRKANQLMVATMGFSGTVTYGGSNGPCFNPAITANATGRIGFSIGSLGSVQTSFDDNMALTFGMPNEPAGSWSYATINIDGVQRANRHLFGENALELAFGGDSDRYIYGETKNDTIRIKCRIDVIGDAARVQWQLTNEDPGGAAHTVGLWFGQWMAMFAATPDPATGAQISGGPFAEKMPYVFVPTQKPVRTDQRWIRSQDPTGFPPYVQFDFGQTTAYGLRVENGPTTATKDATQANEFVIGKGLFLLDAPDGGDHVFHAPPTIDPGDKDIIPDTLIGDTAYIQKFDQQQIAVNQTRTIVQYFRSTWGQSDYELPYTAVVDAPKLVATEDDGSGGSETNGLFKNPFTVRVYVDNVGGYSSSEDGIPLSAVKIKLTLPAGLNFQGNPDTTRFQEQTISQIVPRDIKFVDFTVEADGIEFGDLGYQVDISSIPGNVGGKSTAKTIKGVIQVAATPRYKLLDNGGPTANAITTPFVFTDSSWDVVLGLNSPTDFQAFEWDAQVKGYIISTSAARGKGVFLINNTGAFQSNALGGNPTTPSDTVPNPTDNSGRVVIQLKSGWNLIGNPYNYPISVNQITGVSAANPSKSFGWAQLASQKIVNPSLSYWDASSQTYKFVSGSSARLFPNTAYWIFVNTSADLTMAFPPVFAEGLPGSSRATADQWVQSDKQWRLQLVARSDKSIDDQNFIGVAQNADAAAQLRMMEPPMAPTQDIGVSIEGQLNGSPTRLAQSLSDRATKQEFKVFVQSEKGGEVNLTWPNMNSVPKNVRFRLIDESTNTSRDMRSASGYTFNATAGSTRSFKVQVDVGGSVGAVIGNVVVSGGRSRDGRGTQPFTINYTLSAPASMTVRVLTNSGKEIFTVASGRAVSAGNNSDTWNLKDNANRSVAPGSYRIELIATTPDGQNVRRYVPVNVVR